MTAGRPTFDVHAHCFRPDLLPREVQHARARAHIARRRGISVLGSDDEAAADKLTDRMLTNMADPDGDLLRLDLTGAGVAGAMVIGLDWGLLGADVPSTGLRAQFEWAEALIDRHQMFFSYVFAVDPRRKDAAVWAARAVAQSWVSGLKLYPPTGFSPNDEVCDPIYAAAVGAGAFVMAHTGRAAYPMVLEHGRLEPYAFVQRRHPEIRLVLAHAGWPSWGLEAIYVASGHPSTAIDVSGWQREMADDPTGLERFLARAFAELGPGRVLFGTDHMSGTRLSGEAAVARIAAWMDGFAGAAGRSGIDTSAIDAAAFALLERT